MTVHLRRIVAAGPKGAPRGLATTQTLEALERHGFIWRAGWAVSIYVATPLGIAQAMR
jgi:hypothetical protein